MTHKSPVQATMRGATFKNANTLSLEIPFLGIYLKKFTFMKMSCEPYNVIKEISLRMKNL